MASATGSAKNRLRRFRPWQGQWTIAHRILALNLLTLVVFAVSVLYLDAFRNQLQDERIGRIEREAQLVAVGIIEADARPAGGGDLHQQPLLRARRH
jgi:two-component system, OmpR family, sensor histidine kinase ChvG